MKENLDKKQSEYFENQQLLNQQQLINQQPLVDKVEVSSSEISENSEIKSSKDKTYLDKDLGYVNADYYLEDASKSFGEWARGMTPAGVQVMGSLGGFRDIENLQNKPEVIATQEAQKNSELQLNNQPNQEEQLSNEDLLKLPLKERLEAIRSQHGIEPKSEQPEVEKQKFKGLSR